MHTPTPLGKFKASSQAFRTFFALLTLMVSLGFAPAAWAQSGLFKDFVIINGNFYDTNFRTDNFNYMAGGDGPNNTFTEPRTPTNLGSFDRNSGSLILNGAEVNTFEGGGDVLNSARLLFRVYPLNNAAGTANTGGTNSDNTGGINPSSSFTAVALPEVSSGSNGFGGTNRLFRNSAATRSNAPTLPASQGPINIVNLASGPGTYVLEVFFAAGGSNNGSLFTVRDNRNGANYQATFTITGAAQGSTVWLGGDNPNCLSTGPDANDQNLAFLTAQSNWFDPSNWTNGVPTASTDALVPNYAVSTPTRAANRCVVYPNVRTSPATGPALAKDLTLEGATPNSRSILRLLVGDLKVFGNFLNPADSYIQRGASTTNGVTTTTTFSLSGNGNQSFDGSANFKNFTVEGGGIKTLSQRMNVEGILRFTDGIIVTPGVNATTQGIFLATSSVIIGESETSYVSGIISTKERAEIGVTQNFGNIGIDLTFNSGEPNGSATDGGVRITRTTGETSTSRLNPSPTARSGYSIKRVYGIQPDGASRLGSVLSARLGVRYLDRELQGVPQEDGTGQVIGTTNLVESQLAVFISTNGGSSFSNEGRNSSRGISQIDNRVTLDNLTVFATTTLGESETPLPVSFTYIAARPTREGAVITWGTATEKNNAGFDVEVSTDGKTFRKLNTVVPVSANSNSARNYSYTDGTARTGTRYYRLRQVDLDGKQVYTVTRVVKFSDNGAAIVANSSLFPNPLHDGEQLLLNVSNGVAGQVVVNVSDVLGRQVARMNSDVAAGSSTIVLPSLSGKPAGVYLVRLTMPDGTVQTMKVQKQ